MTYAVIPAKNFHHAKQRLAGVLQEHERVMLAQATLTDTLRACTQAQGLDGVGVVTCDQSVATVAEALGAEVLWEPEARGHSQAVAFGVQVCQQRGLHSMLTLPGDLPLLTVADVQALAVASFAAVVLVPNRDDSGTNAMILSPPACLPVAFGDDSFQRHLRLATARQLAVEVRRLPHVALDLDTPADLAFFIAQRVPCQSWHVLTALGVLDRFPTALAAQPGES